MKVRYLAPEFLSVCGPQTREIYEYWKGLRGDRILPYRADFDPLDVKPYLPGIMLVDLVGTPPDNIYRLVGTREAESRGHDPTGRRVADAYFATSAEDALGNYRFVATERAVLYDCEPVSLPGNRYLGDESLFLPFTFDGESVGQIMVYSHYEDLWHSAASRSRGR